ncbi:hypothetical protein [Cyclobacterium qasimii]|uniref:Uncharacterized protein n=1 Tax=Cyclobacterium qasimii M12-11B TaxID=641524 RepID=S7VBH3_9BACT|nr:hypothetical protein [Cyclobacterium qasimii]EPR66917.1 hypothetical protein ADICYQ_4178 [Cyclobacterium qasimii M12-11B]
MKKRNKEYLQSAVITGGTILGAYLVRKGLEELYEKKQEKKLPKIPIRKKIPLKRHCFGQ